MSNNKKMAILCGLLVMTAIVLAACASPTATEAPTAVMTEAPTAAPTEAPVQTISLGDLQPETCTICHADVGEEKHQAIYDQYTDKSTLGLTINSVSSVGDGAGGFNAKMTFTITNNGLPFIDADGLPSLDQKRFYTVQYDSATRMFTGSQSFGDIKSLGNGVYTAVSVAGNPAAPAPMAYAVEQGSGEAYGYVADNVLDTEGMTLYSDVANAGKAFGDVTSYESVANVAGCEKCHGTPYMKHGYRNPVVAGLSDFSTCKTCHYDTRKGGHEDWQILVDNPARYAEIHGGSDKTDDEKVQYGYTANIMNDVHMSHAMEFPYPQSMSNCATCHEGKLDAVLTDANFKVETCKSCHPVAGPEEGTEANRAPALASIMPHDLPDADCNTCHVDGGVAPVFSKIHSGYNEVIYADTTGTKYSDVFTVSVDEASLADNVLSIKFSAVKNVELTALSPADITPMVMVGLYGYDTKDFLVSPHGRDADNNRYLEFPIDGTTVNPRFKVVSAANGSWEVTADLSMWADMMADGTVKRAEIAVLPKLTTVVGEVDSNDNGESDDTTYALNAPSRTFDLGANAFDDEYFSAIVNVADGCNTCHDALATTFHSPDRGGNVTVCRMCHTPENGGSHLEMQSRSIDGYIHAIHSFQAFDPGDIDFSDPVQELYYELKTEVDAFPNFTIKNCESCHNEGMFNVPDQSKSLPAVMSASDTFSAGRNIGDVASFVTGPANKACGGCHRAQMINEDNAVELAAFNVHTTNGGYMVENGDGVWQQVVASIMGLFK